MSRGAHLLFIAAFLAVPAWAQQPAFLAEAEDVPLPPGVEETVFGASFAGADGRLVETTADGETTAEAVRSFYDSAMPPLGWGAIPRTDGPQVFQRGREQLTIHIAQEGPRVHVRYRLVSRAASMALD
jgi:hypothetical protein